MYGENTHGPKQPTDMQHAERVIESFGAIESYENRAQLLALLAEMQARSVKDAPDE